MQEQNNEKAIIDSNSCMSIATTNYFAKYREIVIVSNCIKNIKISDEIVTNRGKPLLIKGNEAN